MSNKTAMELLMLGAADDFATMVDPHEGEVVREVAAMRLTGAASDHPEVSDYMTEQLRRLDPATLQRANLLLVELAQKMLAQLGVELARG